MSRQSEGLERGASRYGLVVNVADELARAAAKVVERGLFGKVLMHARAFPGAGLATTVVQFAGGDDGINGPGAVNNYYHGPSDPTDPVPVQIVATDDLGNVIADDSETQVTVSIGPYQGPGVDAHAPTINGGPGPVVVTMVNGQAEVTIFAVNNGGYVKVTLSDPSTPGLNVADVAIPRIGGKPDL